jgi:hypothetical protein
MFAGNRASSAQARRRQMDAFSCITIDQSARFFRAHTELKIEACIFRICAIAFQESIGAQGAIYVTAKHGLIGLDKVVAKGPSKFKISTFSLYDLTLSARLR